MGMVISHDMLLGRWRLSLELFGRVFMEDVGAEPGSVCTLCTLIVFCMLRTSFIE
jgi:E3 ubiquitin-protein ligase EDD1